MRTFFGWPVLIATLGFVTASRAQGAADAPGPGGAPRLVRIGHYQCVCRQGDLEANLATLRRGLAQAADARLDIVSFPECFLTGYFAREQDARAHSFAIDSREMRQVLAASAGCATTVLVGFNEARGPDLYNTVAVVERGALLGRYSKALPYEGYFMPGRDFPVFEKKGLTFGVVICSDGGYIEPSRILALKGARLIFAPHYNYVADPVAHSVTVRHDHVARAVENGVYFLRGNNVVPPGTKVDGLRDAGCGYGDSYLLDPNGQIIAGAGLFHEHLMICQIDLDQPYRAHWNRRSARSALELLDHLRQALPAPQTPATHGGK